MTGVTDVADVIGEHEMREERKESAAGYGDVLFDVPPHQSLAAWDDECPF